MERRSTNDTKTEKWSQVQSVFVVDDDENWCFIIKRILQKAGFGKEVITASNGLEAFKKLQTMAAEEGNLPELIFLDIKMPVMDGFGFLDEVSKAEDLNLSHTQIYICSSSFLPRDKERADLYPIAGFITKPLTVEMLNNIVA